MAETELKVILKAKELAEHTLRVTSNCNRYPKKYRFSLVDKMQNKALEIYEYLYEANRTDLKQYLKWCLSNIEEMVSSLGLSLNGKTQIVPFKNGILFTGFHHYVTKDGKYIRKLNGDNKRRIRKKIRIWAKLVKSGRMTEKKFYEKYNAWKNHALHGNCIKLCHSMDLDVKELLRKEE